MHKPHYTLSPPATLQVLTLHDLLSEFRNREILDAVQTRIAEGFVNFAVDLSDVTVMNSVGINLLIQLRALVRKAQGRLVLAGAPTKILQLLEMTKLRPLFHLADSLEAAMQSLTDA